MAVIEDQKLRDVAERCAQICEALNGSWDSDGGCYVCAVAIRHVMLGVPLTDLQKDDFRLEPVSHY